MEDHLNNKDRLNKEWEASIGMSSFFFFQIQCDIWSMMKHLFG